MHRQLPVYPVVEPAAVTVDRQKIETPRSTYATRCSVGSTGVFWASYLVLLL